MSLVVRSTSLTMTNYFHCDSTCHSRNRHRLMTHWCLESHVRKNKTFLTLTLLNCSSLKVVGWRGKQRLFSLDSGINFEGLSWCSMILSSHQAQTQLLISSIVLLSWIINPSTTSIWLQYFQILIINLYASCINLSRCNKFHQHSHAPKTTTYRKMFH